jgi:predicted nucleic acid-binding protein
MIAADTSTVVAFLAGESGRDVDLLDDALAHNQVCLSPVVISELLSAPQATPALDSLLFDLPLLTIEDGYWHRAGRMRASLLARGYKAFLADTLISQSCLDHGVSLLTRDADFRHFAKYCGLRLA